MSIRSDQSFAANFTPPYYIEDHDDSDLQNTFLGRSAEDITGVGTYKSDAPQKSMIRKILNIAAKVAVVATAVLFVKKVCFAAVSATFSSPFSLALTVPGVFLWYVFLQENGSELINKINCKINNLI